MSDRERRDIDRRTFARWAAGLVAGSALITRTRTAIGQAVAPDTEASGIEWMPRRSRLGDVGQLLELASVPGAAVAIVEDGRSWVHGYGIADRATSASVRGDTVFEGASLGKPLFALAVLKMVAAGTLDLDRPLATHLVLPDGDDARMRRITARHVLSHTTGLPNWRQEPSRLEPASDPGKAFSYSGEAYVYLQRVVEKVTGRPFGAWIRETVLEPLGMKSSTWIWTPALGERMAMGHDDVGTPLEVYASIGREAEKVAQRWGKPVEQWRYEDAIAAVPLIRPTWPPLPVFMVPNAAASFLTTAEDYARFLAGLVEPQSAGLGLDPRLVREMVAPRIRLNSALAWGLGWGLEEVPHGRMLWHWGANMSFRNFVLADPADRRAVVVLTNGLNGPKVYQRIVTAVTGTDHPAFLWRAV